MYLALFVTDLRVHLIYDPNAPHTHIFRMGPVYSPRPTFDMIEVLLIPLQVVSSDVGLYIIVVTY